MRSVSRMLSCTDLDRRCDLRLGCETDEPGDGDRSMVFMLSHSRTDLGASDIVLWEATVVGAGAGASIKRVVIASSP